MPKGGKRYPLSVYRYMLDRWWRATLTIGVVILLNAGALAALPLAAPQLPFMWVDDLTLTLLAGLGGAVVVFSLFLIAIRKSGYVQLFQDHLRVVTFFFRFNIAYKRIRATTTAELGSFKPARSVSSWQRGIIAPLARLTAIRLDFSANPMPRWQMALFLSPLFFADKTPHILLLVNDWMGLSTEIESRRAGIRSARRTDNYSAAPDQTPPRPAAPAQGRPKRPARPSAESGLLSSLKDDNDR
jgi:hypothetical protein